MAARIQVPDSARRGELIEIRLLIQHPMETGYRFDDAGKPIPRNVITGLSCRYNGKEVMRAEMTQGIAANPYLQFHAVAEASGEIEISWVDDEGVQGSERRRITVSG
jgi:sulfur-oxidizing protein SoxZ